MKLIGYVEVREGEALANQYNAIRKYCQLFGYELVDVVADEQVAPTTALEQRPGGERVLNRLHAGDANGIVLDCINRAFPCNADGLCHAIALKQRGYTIHAVRDCINTTTFAGWLTLVLRTLLMEYPLHTAAEVTTKDHAAEQISTPGLLTPYGCIRIGRKLYRDPVTWLTRERIVHMRRAERRDFEDIINYLHSRNIPAPGGGTIWHAVTIQGLLRHHDALCSLPVFRPPDS